MNNQKTFKPNSENKKYSDEHILQQQTITNIRKKYGSDQHFMLIFNKDIQIKTALYPERSYKGTAPTLYYVAKTYNQEVVTTWLMAQLEDINDFTSVPNKLSIEQLEKTAQIIGTEYKYLKVTEIQLFLFRLKAGRYGHFYGNIDPLKITNSLKQFTEERKEEINTIERQEERKKREQRWQQWVATAISREQYQQLKTKQK